MENNRKTIKERAKEIGMLSQVRSDYPYDKISVEFGYAQGTIEQKDIDIDKACNIFCYTGCPHKIDSYDCLKDKCDTWKIFRRMMEE